MPTGCQKDRQRDRPTDGQTDRQTEKQKQTDRKTDRRRKDFSAKLSKQKLFKMSTGCQKDMNLAVRRQLESPFLFGWGRIFLECSQS